MLCFTGKDVGPGCVQVKPGNLMSFIGPVDDSPLWATCRTQLRSWEARRPFRLLTPGVKNSVDLVTAVSPNCIRLNVGKPLRRGVWDSWWIRNPRKSGMQSCATFSGNVFGMFAMRRG